MKEPDKIYAKIIAGSLCVSRKPNKIFGEPYPEYIRKDALLEKFNEFKSSSLPGKTIVVYLKEYLESL